MTAIGGAVALSDLGELVDAGIAAGAVEKRGPISWNSLKQTALLVMTPRARRNLLRGLSPSTLACA